MKTLKPCSVSPSSILFTRDDPKSLLWIQADKSDTGLGYVLDKYWACQTLLSLRERLHMGLVLQWQEAAMLILALESTATAKSLQSCPTLCDPIDSSPPGSPIPGILQARTLEWVAISFSNAWKWKVKGKSLSRVRLLETPWTAAYQAPTPMGFSRQEYWSGVPLPSLESNVVLNFVWAGLVLWYFTLLLFPGMWNIWHKILISWRY